MGATAAAGLALRAPCSPCSAPPARRAPRRRRAAGAAALIVFVHGNGDSSALWINNIWRFETNG